MSMWSVFHASTSSSPPTTGYTNAQPPATPIGAAPPPRPTTVKTVRYFVREGQRPETGSVLATSLAAESTAPGRRFGSPGDRPLFAQCLAEQSGDQSVLESGQTLIAPEVAHIEFRYFDSTLGQVIDYWDMKEKSVLPPAIEVRIWILPASADATEINPIDLTSISPNATSTGRSCTCPTLRSCSRAPRGWLAERRARQVRQMHHHPSSTSGGSSISGSGSVRIW